MYKVLFFFSASVPFVLNLWGVNIPSSAVAEKMKTVGIWHGEAWWAYESTRHLTAARHISRLSLSFFLKRTRGHARHFVVVWKMAREKKHSPTHPRSWDSNHILKQTRQGELAAWQKTDNYISCFSLFEDDGLVGEAGGGCICSGKVGRSERHLGIAVWMLNASQPEQRNNLQWRNVCANCQRSPT